MFEHFHVTALGAVVYVIWLLPVLFLLWWLFVNFQHNKLVVSALALVLITFPFWDVFMISRDATQLCRNQGGLRIYKQVEADGFWGGAGHEYWKNYGFTYIESGGGDLKSHYSLKGDKITHHHVQEFVSRYYVTTKDNHKKITKNITRTTFQVFEISSGEVLGQWVRFNIGPGWFDRLFVAPLFGPIVWHCGDTSSSGESLNYRDLVKATIKPKTTNE